MTEDVFNVSKGIVLLLFIYYTKR